MQGPLEIDSPFPDLASSRRNPLTDPLEAKVNTDSPAQTLEGVLVAWDLQPTSCSANQLKSLNPNSKLTSTFYIQSIEKGCGPGSKKKKKP